MDYQIRHIGNPSGLPEILPKIDPWYISSSVFIGHSPVDRSYTCCFNFCLIPGSSANWQELTEVHQLLYFAHLLSLWYIQSQNIVCQCGEDVLMSSMLIHNLTSRCLPSQALWDQPTLTGCLCSATSSPRRFAVTVPPCRSIRRLSSSRIVFPSRRSYVSHPSRVSDLDNLSWPWLHDSQV